MLILILIFPMSDHLVLFVDQLARPVPVDPVEQPVQLPSEPSLSPVASDADAASGSGGSDSAVDPDGEDCGEEEPLIQMVECRICQEEDSVSNLETPCACRGSLKVYKNLIFCDFLFFNGFEFFKVLYCWSRQVKKNFFVLFLLILMSFVFWICLFILV